MCLLLPLNLRQKHLDWTPLILGDLRRGKQLFEWLSDEDNRELADAIEKVNNQMLDQLIEGSDSLAVLFCKYSFHHHFRSLQSTPTFLILKFKEETYL